MTGSHPYLPSPQEQTQLAALALAAQDAQLRLGLQVPGQPSTLELPDALTRLVALLIREGAAGHAISVVLHDQDLSTSEAARLLGVSRPFLVSHLLETGKLAHHRVGSHRRITQRDLHAYQAEQTRRRALAAELSAEDQALGLY